MSTALWAITHQDDEALAKGSAIRAHLEAGVDCHVLLLTTGSGSGAQAGTGLNDEEFVLARDDEFHRSCRALGVRPDRIRIPPVRAGGGELTPGLVQTMLWDALVTLPAETWIKTYSDKDAPGRHPDHLAAGQGLRQAEAAGWAVAPRFYIEPWLLQAWRTANPSVRWSTERTSANGVLRVRDAFDVYAEKDPHGFKFGIGRASVSYFDQLRTDPANYWHA